MKQSLAYLLSRNREQTLVSRCHTHSSHRHGIMENEKEQESETMEVVVSETHTYLALCARHYGLDLTYTI